MQALSLRAYFGTMAVRLSFLATRLLLNTQQGTDVRRETTLKHFANQHNDHHNVANRVHNVQPYLLARHTKHA